MDLLMRRDSEIAQFGGKNPFASKKKEAKDVGFASPFHAEMRMNDLCGDLHLSFKHEALEEVQEVCEDVVSEYPDEIKRAFSILGKGADYGNPVQTVCVNTAELCKRKEFDDNFPFLLNMHANITNVKIFNKAAALRHGDDLSHVKIGRKVEDEPKRKEKKEAPKEKPGKPVNTENDGKHTEL